MKALLLDFSKCHGLLRCASLQHKQQAAWPPAVTSLWTKGLEGYVLALDIGLCRSYGKAAQSQKSPPFLAAQKASTATTMQAQAINSPPESMDASKIASISKSQDPAKETGRQKGPKQQLAMMQTGRKLYTSILSPGILAEPYRGEPPKLQWSAYLKLEGWRERKKRFLGGLKSIYTMAKCKKHIPGFDLKSFKQDAIKLYTDVNSMLAQGDRTLLRHVTTPTELTHMKRQMKMREDGGWSRVEWSLASHLLLQHAELVQARLIGAGKDEMTFAQLTVRFRSSHKFAAFNQRGQLVAGDRAKVWSVQDVWILERSFQNSAQSRWRLAGRIGGSAAAARAALSWRERISRWLSGRPKPNMPLSGAAAK